METLLTQNAREIIEKRYLRSRQFADGVVRRETIPEWVERIATAIGNGFSETVSKDPDDNRVSRIATFANMINCLQFIPNTPCLMNAGMPSGQLAACFVLPIADDMGRADDGIFTTLRNAALIQQSGGGIGFDWSALRPEGDIVASSGGKASGPVSFMRIYNEAFGGIAQGGCLSVDTLVNTDHGLLRLDEIVDTTKVGWQNHTLSIPTDDGLHTSQRCFNNGISPVFRILTDNGIEITGTANHKIKVMTDDGPILRHISELKHDDYIVMILGQHLGTIQTLTPVENNHQNTSHITFPTTIDIQFAFILGYLGGNGFVASADDDYRIGFSVPHKSYLMTELPRMLTNIFPECVIHVQQKPNDASVTFVINSVLIKKFLISNGLSKNKSYDVHVPRAIRQSPPEIVGSYIRGVFEADANSSHNYPCLCSTSEQFVREIAMLLIGLGCPCNIWTNNPVGRMGNRPLWHVRIESHIGFNTWKTRIGCDPRSRFAALNDINFDPPQEHTFTIPNAKWWLNPVLDNLIIPNHTGKTARSANPKLRHKLLRYTSGARSLSMNAIRDLSRVFPEFAEHVRPVNNLWFIKITDVIPVGESLTLDMEVDENHTYIANGMHVSNSRRGANMAVLRVDHPDIEKFIDCKRNTEIGFTNFNISVAITESFMSAVRDKKSFDLINPRTRKVARTIQATDLFHKICESTHSNGEPGILFIDRINEENPVPAKYTIVATNPCGEQNLGPYENCCLGHINLARICDTNGVIDWSLLRETVRQAVIFLDGIVSTNKYIPTVPQLREAAMATRRIGLGITGLADLFVRRLLVYGSPESARLAELIAFFIRYWALDMSAELARVIGPFPAIEGSIWDHSHTPTTVARLHEQYKRMIISGMPRVESKFGETSKVDPTWADIDWLRLEAKIVAHGVRNACLLSIAPTGTTSLILGVDGYGCEPIFSLSYTRTLQDGKKMTFCSELASEIIHAHVSDEVLAMRMVTFIMEHGRAPSPDDIKLPAESRYVRVLAALGATALNVKPEEHLRIQAALQYWVDNSISKTINCANNTTVEDIERIYMSAWEQRLKGVAIYRTGSREKEVLVGAAGASGSKGPNDPLKTDSQQLPVAASTASSSAQECAEKVADPIQKRTRPTIIPGCTYRCDTCFGHVFTTLNFDTDGAFEVFITLGKSGTEAQAACEAIGRLGSAVLRMNANLPPRARIELIIDQLSDIGGSRQSRDVASKRIIRSIPDAVAFSLEEIMKQHEGLISRSPALPDVIVSSSAVASSSESGIIRADAEATPPHHQSSARDICPTCKKMTLIRAERCAHCEECSYSAC